jgi:hypothetical protein
VSACALGEVAGDQCLRGCRCRLLLLQRRGRGRGAWRLASRRHTCRRPVSNNVLNLSTLTGAMSGTAGDALTTKEMEGMSSRVSKLRACRKKCYLPQAGGASTVPTCASAVPAGTSTDDPVMGGSMPASRVDSMATPETRGDPGAGSHLSEVVRSPLLSSSLEDEFANTGGGERP